MVVTGSMDLDGPIQVDSSSEKCDNEQNTLNIQSQRVPPQDLPQANNFQRMVIDNNEQVNQDIQAGLLNGDVESVPATCLASRTEQEQEEKPPDL